MKCEFCHARVPEIVKHLITCRQFNEDSDKIKVLKLMIMLRDLSSPPHGGQENKLDKYPEFSDRLQYSQYVNYLFQ